VGDAATDETPGRPDRDVLVGLERRTGTARSQRCARGDGHPYSGDNLYIRNCGRRMCRACNNARRKKSHQRAKSAA